ncbi:MAG TPA: PQQ-dependent dehydrogenase, methanol/ethanol family [Vicinamibacterales bacterium]|jgi:alcohol dehydrogenase (cytochrome c)|nr:PQQ-dependent dehydrogenase, methanol/ethanol family [Vicinamibacterales bacterium]
MHLTLRIVAALALSIAVAASLASQAPGQAPPQTDTKLPPLPPPKLPLVTAQDLLDGFKNPARWLTFSGDYSGRRHSPLKQITPENVKRLAPLWTFQAEGMVINRGYETTPLVLDGVMYITGNNNYAWAVDMRSGRQIWRYRRVLPPGLTYGGANPSNRGFAALGNRLFMGTVDAHLVALDRDTGEALWDVALDDYKVGHAVTAAPLVIKDKVITGNAGGDLPTRGFLDAYDAATGKRAWRFYTIPGPGEPGSETWSDPDVLPRGGGATWMTGSYDPELNLIYWGTGNPNPDYYGGDRKGNNLYTASLIAIDADTGKLRWHFQFTPHDLHDWDSTHVPVLGDVTVGGQTRKAVMVANRNGFFYVLDRTSGKLIHGKPFTQTKWARELGPDGTPIVLNEGTMLPGDTKEPQCVPDLRGGTNFNPPSYDPSLQLFFVMARETCAIYTPFKQEMVPGRSFTSGGVRKLPEPDHGAVRAIDAKTGAIKWEYVLPTPSLAGVMSTASGLVFAGDNEGYFNAFDSRTGKKLWSYRTGSLIWGAAPTTVMLDGKQLVMLPSGNTLVAFGLMEQ